MNMEGNLLLRVIEGEQEYCVVYAHDNQDWVAKFEKSWPEAKYWAQHMADTYNHRCKSPEDVPSNIPIMAQKEPEDFLK